MTFFDLFINLLFLNRWDDSYFRLIKVLWGWILATLTLGWITGCKVVTSIEDTCYLQAQPPRMVSLEFSKVQRCWLNYCRPTSLRSYNSTHSVNIQCYFFHYSYTPSQCKWFSNKGFITTRKKFRAQMCKWNCHTGYKTTLLPEYFPRLLSSWSLYSWKRCTHSHHHRQTGGTLRKERKWTSQWWALDLEIGFLPCSSRGNASPKCTVTPDGARRRSGPSWVKLSVKWRRRNDASAVQQIIPRVNKVIIVHLLEGKRKRDG